MHGPSQTWSQLPPEQAMLQLSLDEQVCLQLEPLHPIVQLEPAPQV